MFKHTTIFFALSFVLVRGSVNVGGDDCHVAAPWLSIPLACPEFQTCADANKFCIRKAGQDGFTNFTCNDATGSGLGFYDCATRSYPLTNCTGVLNNKCSLLPVVLGQAGQFAVLAGAAITNTGPTVVVSGSLGVSPGTSIGGFPPGEYDEALYSSNRANGASAAGIGDLSTAYDDAAGRTLCPIIKIGELGGMTLPPGLYKSTAGMEVTGSDLYLDAGHDKTAVWIFQMATTFTSAEAKKIILINGAKAGNVFWQVGSAGTIGGTNLFQGTMMAYQAITVGSGTTVNGRVLASIAAISLASNTITIPPTE